LGAGYGDTTRSGEPRSPLSSTSTQSIDHSLLPNRFSFAQATKAGQFSQYFPGKGTIIAISGCFRNDPNLADFVW
jgi:hypothetical protein